MFRIFGIGVFGQNKGQGHGNSPNESVLYARAFGKGSRFERKTTVTEANGKPDDKMSESEITIAGGLGMLEPFGSR